MAIKYRKAYLTDGTKVKITEELFNQLQVWESEGYTFHISFIDLLKIQDNEMLNQQRNYYLHNISLEGEFEKEKVNLKLIIDSKNLFNDPVENIGLKNQLNTVLGNCSETQKRRFIKYYYLDFTLEMIANQEERSISSVYRSIKKVEKKLINLK